MLDPVLLVFTVEGEDLIRQKGWSGYWPVNVERAKQFKYIIFCQNLHKAQVMKEEWGDFATATKPHSTGFLLARISDVVPASQYDLSPTVKDRWIFILSEAAAIDRPNLWNSWRFPVNYEHTLQDLGLDPGGLQFEPMPPPRFIKAVESAKTASLLEHTEETKPLYEASNTLTDIEKYAANRLGVRQDEVEVTIRLLPRRRVA